jgi:hypothetical protein
LNRLQQAEESLDLKEYIQSPTPIFRYHTFWIIDFR